jgi:tetratricopeptide (TPR) repeat protein
VAWSHDGRKIAAGNSLGLCEVWEVLPNRKLVSVRIHPSQVNDLAWSLDDLRLASGGINGQVHLWDSATGQELLALEPDSAPIRHIRWSPDGRKLAAVSDDGVIKVWDAAAGYELPRRDFWHDLIEPRQWKEYARLIDQQHWSQAADLLKALIAAGGQDVAPLYYHAHLSLQLEDQAGYREACKRMLSTFADTEGSLEALRTAWACALCPGALEDYSLAITLARRAFDLEFDAQARAVTRGVFFEALGAILYRAGRLDEAIQRLTEGDRLVKEPSAATPSAPAYTWFFLAMAHQRLGHREEAKKWLDKAVAWTEKTLRDADQGAADLPWNRRLTLKLLREEAAAVLGVDKKPPVGKEKAGKAK